MGRQSQHCLEQSHQNMRFLVLIGSLLASTRCVPLDAGYGAPLAPVVSAPVLVNSVPAPAAPVPLQLVHNAPLIHSVPQPVVHSVPVPAPLAVAPTPLAAPVAIAPAPTPLAAPVPVAPIAPVAPIVG